MHGVSARARSRAPRPPDASLELSSSCPAVCQPGDEGTAWVKAERREDFNLFYWALLPPALLPSQASKACPTLPTLPGSLPAGGERRVQGESPIHLLRLEHQSRSFLLQFEVPRTRGRDFTLWALVQGAFKEQWIPRESLHGALKR